ncbi:MAG: hypothetical protein ACE5KO_01575 [Candidatus Bathyarchaeia archaeon]
MATKQFALEVITRFRHLGFDAEEIRSDMQYHNLGHQRRKIVGKFKIKQTFFDELQIIEYWE